MSEVVIGIKSKTVTKSLSKLHIYYTIKNNFTLTFTKIYNSCYWAQMSGYINEEYLSISHNHKSKGLVTGLQQTSQVENFSTIFNN